MNNLAHDWVASIPKTLAEARADWEGQCIDFAGDLEAAVGVGRIAYFETPDNEVWKYHAALEIDGMIHDLWHDGPALPLAEYMNTIGASTVEYPSEEEEGKAMSTKLDFSEVSVLEFVGWYHWRMKTNPDMGQGITLDKFDVESALSFYRDWAQGIDNLWNAANRVTTPTPTPPVTQAKPEGR
jgi:hypothetical protein